MIDNSPTECVVGCDDRQPSSPWPLTPIFPGSPYPVPKNDGVPDYTLPIDSWIDKEKLL
jgi:hypothetical protein